MQMLIYTVRNENSKYWPNFDYSKWSPIKVIGAK